MGVCGLLELRELAHQEAVKRSSPKQKLLSGPRTTGQLSSFSASSTIVDFLQYERYTGPSPPSPSVCFLAGWLSPVEFGRRNNTAAERNDEEWIKYIAFRVGVLATARKERGMRQASTSRYI